jgi:hypothetical protein
MSKRIMGLVVTLLLVALVLPVGAQDDTPMVEVFDQVSFDGTVTIDQVYSEGPGFVVIHADGGGAPGPVIGYAPVPDGASSYIQVPIDVTAATPTLYAMLHTDTGTVGTYEFGTVEGADGPVMVGDAPVTPAFQATIITVQDQPLVDNTVTISSVTVAEQSWLVIHSGDDQTFGPVLGQTLLNPGTTTNVAVTLSGDITPVLWPMLHADTGEAGVYEFGTVEGADAPLAPGGQMAVLPLWTVPHIRAGSQIVMHGDGMDAGGMAPTFTASSVLMDGPGFLVIHADANGAAGPVLGFAPVQAGVNSNVTVNLDPAGLTPVLWPMLHVDTGTVGTYEFGTVEGADGPVVVNDMPVMMAVHAAPSLTLADQPLDGNEVMITEAVIDAPGWLAIHSSQDGAPGPVLAAYPLPAGVSRNFDVEIDPAAAGSQIFPMLHYDTGEIGVYEFGTVEGADGPVTVGGDVVVAPLNITAGEPSGEHEMSATEEASAPMALDGDALVSERCTVCHSRDRIDSKDKDEAGWTETVDRMISHGAQLNADERQAVIDYLVSTH